MLAIAPNIDGYLKVEMEDENRIIHKHPIMLFVSVLAQSAFEGKPEIKIIPIALINGELTPVGGKRLIRDE